ncbi:MAG TPA: hypothetical protein VFS43_16195 [Polyangiaceae bacterium]|nr:hypothetical protein [Polyangiaceae bacterium]
MFADLGLSSFSSGSMLALPPLAVPGASLTKLMIFLQSVLDPEDASVAVGEGRPISLAQLYPIHGSEIGLISKVGPTKFFLEFGIDFMGVHRRSATGAVA